MKEAGDDSLLDRICLTLVRLGVLSEDVQGRPFTELPTGWAVKGGSVRPHSSIIAISKQLAGFEVPLSFYQLSWLPPWRRGSEPRPFVSLVTGFSLGHIGPSDTNSAVVVYLFF